MRELITSHWPRNAAEALSQSADCVLVAPCAQPCARFLCHAAVLSLDSPVLATLATLEAEAGGTLPELRLQATALPPSLQELGLEAWQAFLSCLYRASGDYQVGGGAVRRRGAGTPGPCSSGCQVTWLQWSCSAHPVATSALSMTQLSPGWSGFGRRRAPCTPTVRTVSLHLRSSPSTFLRCPLLLCSGTPSAECSPSPSTLERAGCWGGRMPGCAASAAASLQSPPAAARRLSWRLGTAWAEPWPCCCPLRCSAWRAAAAVPPSGERVVLPAGRAFQYGVAGVLRSFGFGFGWYLRAPGARCWLSSAPTPQLCRPACFLLAAEFPAGLATSRRLPDLSLLPPWHPPRPRRFDGKQRCGRLKAAFNDSQLKCLVLDAYWWSREAQVGAWFVNSNWACCPGTVFAASSSAWCWTSGRLLLVEPSGAGVCTSVPCASRG